MAMAMSPIPEAHDVPDVPLDWLAVLLERHLIYYEVHEAIVRLIVGLVIRLSSYMISFIVGSVLLLMRYRHYQMKAWTVEATVPVLFDHMFRKNGKYNFPLVQFVLDRALESPARHTVSTLILVVDGDTTETSADLCAALEIAIWIRERSRKHNVTVYSFLRGTAISSTGYVLASCAHDVRIYYTTQLCLLLSPGMEGMARIFSEDKADNISSKRVDAADKDIKLVGQEAVQCGVVDKVGSYIEFILYEMHGSPVTIEDQFTYAFSDDRSYEWKLLHPNL